MPKMSFENHIMTQFDEELEEIRTQLMEMGGKVEQQLKNSIQAFIRSKPNVLATSTW
jgi:phosphate transport system protein